MNHLDILYSFIEHFDDKVSQSKKLAIGHEITFPTIDNPDNFKTSPTFGQVDTKRSEFLAAIEKKDKILSKRQRECVKLLARGLSAKEIAKQLNVSHRTIEDYIATLRKKLNAKNITKLVVKTLEQYK